MATTSARPEAPTGLAKAHRAAALLFLALAALVQFFLAGLAAFGHESWDAHAAMGSLLGILALVVLILAAVGRREALPASALLFGLMVLQTVLGAAGHDVSVLGALHPVNGLLVLAAAMLAATGRPLRAIHGSPRT
jgi:peptidoglycan/LPS O-acetylase OafA/YrhL